MTLEKESHLLDIKLFADRWLCYLPRSIRTTSDVYVYSKTYPVCPPGCTNGYWSSTSQSAKQCQYQTENLLSFLPTIIIDNTPLDWVTSFKYARWQWTDLVNQVSTSWDVIYTTRQGQPISELTCHSSVQTWNTPPQSDITPRSPPEATNHYNLQKRAAKSDKSTYTWTSITLKACKN